MIGVFTDRPSVLEHVIALLLDDVAVTFTSTGLLLVDIVNVCGSTTVVT